MGAKCCMPVREDMPMILREKYRLPHELYAQRNNRCSPSWSFRCDNRTHIEDIVDYPARLSHEHGGIVASEFKSAGDTEIEGLSDGSSSSDAFRTPRWQKSSILGSSQTSTAGKMV